MESSSTNSLNLLGSVPKEGAPQTSHQCGSSYARRGCTGATVSCQAWMTLISKLSFRSEDHFGEGESSNQKALCLFRCQNLLRSQSRTISLHELRSLWVTPLVGLQWSLPSLHSLSWIVEGKKYQGQNLQEDPVSTQQSIIDLSSFSLQKCPSTSFKGRETLAPTMKYPIQTQSRCFFFALVLYSTKVSQLAFTVKFQG